MSLDYSTHFFYKLNLKLRIDPKMCSLRNLEKICQKHLAALVLINHFQLV